jgi:hypothetical protein
VKLDHIDVRFMSNARHLRRRGVDEHAYSEQVSVGSGRASGGDAGPRHRRGDLPSRGRENEADQIRPGGCGDYRMLGIAQPTNLDHTPASEKPAQSFLNRN